MTRGPLRNEAQGVAGAPADANTRLRPDNRDQLGRSSGAGPPAVLPDRLTPHSAMALQRLAGNRALTSVLTVQREEDDAEKAAGQLKSFGSQAEDWWHHVSGWVSHDKPQDGDGKDGEAKDGEAGEGGSEGSAKEEGSQDWAEQPKDIAEHTHQVFIVGEQVADLAREKLLYAGDEEGAEKAAQFAEDMKSGGEYLEKGTKGFSWIVAKVKLAIAAHEFHEALKELNAMDDIRADPKRAAEAFDSLFGAAGEIASALPEGPWSGYFEFLEYFKKGKGFFASMYSKVNVEGIYDKQRLRSQGLDENWNPIN